MVNNTGMVQATSVRQENGEIILEADNGTVASSGTLEASGKGVGQSGTVETSGTCPSRDDGCERQQRGPSRHGCYVAAGSGFHQHLQRRLGRRIRPGLLNRRHSQHRARTIAGALSRATSRCRIPRFLVNARPPVPPPTDITALSSFGNSSLWQ